MPRAALACLLLASTAAFADVAPFPRPTPPPAECRADSECVITTWEGCCGSCCPRMPYAMSAANLKAAQQRCMAVRCKAPACDEVACAMVVPEPASSFRAVCEAGRCVARRVSEVAECRRDADCTVVTAMPPAGAAACHASPCGCCPVNAAVPVEQARPRPAPPPPPKKGERPSTPAFGLSTGDGRPRPPEVPPPSCSPCPQPPPANASCIGGKCQLTAPRPRPIPPG